jgi:hypothetical protein
MLLRTDTRRLGYCFAGLFSTFILTMVALIPALTVTGITVA